MRCSLIILVHIRLIIVTTMAMAIASSSRLTHVGPHGSIVMQGALIMRCYKAIIGRVSKLLIPVPIWWIILSIVWSIQMSMRSSIRCSMGCPMRRSIVRDMGSSMRWNMRLSKNRDMTSRHNRRYLNLRYYRANSHSMNMASSNIPARRTT